MILSQLMSFGQKLNHISEVDIDKDHVKEKLLFYDSYEAEFIDTEFSKFCIVSGLDTICVENIEVWVPLMGLYANADISIDNRVGVFHNKDRTFIWLTGYQYGCCYNNTTILEWNKNSLKKVYSDDYEVQSIEEINNKKYMVGNYSLRELYGDMNGDFYFSSFFPTEYRLIFNDMKVDSSLTKKRNLTIPVIENDFEVYKATIVHINYTGEQIMVSNSLKSSVRARDYGIISLTKLDKEYFGRFEKKELRIIRNEIFAFHGYSFSSPDLKEYYEKKPWYRPTEKSSESIADQLSEIEKYNINLIKEIEKTAGNRVDG